MGARTYETPDDAVERVGAPPEAAPPEAAPDPVGRSEPGQGEPDWSQAGPARPGRPPGRAVATDSPLQGAINGQVDLMAYPFFGLSKTPSRRPIKFMEHAVSVEVRPSEGGVATIYDKEILIYLASLAIDRLERGGDFDGVLTFTAYDFFKLAGLSGASGKNYQRLSASLDRLQGTQVRTTIETGGVNIDGWFSWISEAQVIFTRDASGAKRARAFRVRITDWLVRAIAADGSVLSYDRSYFKLSAIERRLYEIARAGCAREGGRAMVIELGALRQRVGVTSPLKKFRQLLAQIAEKDALPAYRVRLRDSDAKTPLARIPVELTVRPTPPSQSVPIQTEFALND